MLYDRARLDPDASVMQQPRTILQNDRISKQSQLIAAEPCPQSVVSTMEKFVKAVNEMNTNVILPTKLLDKEESPGANIPILLRGGNNRYDFYHCLNIIKKDLILGLSCDDDDDDDNNNLLRASDNGTTLTLKMLERLTRQHNAACAPRQQRNENLPKRKISLYTPAEHSIHNLTQENSTTAVNSFQRHDSWASSKPEQQPSQKRSRSTISEYYKHMLKNPIRRHSIACTQENSTSAVYSFPRRDSWASMSSVPEQQPSQKSSRSTISEYHKHVLCDSGGECEEEVVDVMNPIEIAEQLREHLQELQVGLHRLTNTAKYITKSIE